MSLTYLGKSQDRGFNGQEIFKKNKLFDALKKSNLKPIVDSLEAETLGQLAHDLHTVTYYWLGDPTEKRINALRKSIPLLNEIIDFDLILKRIESLDSFKRSSFGVHISDFLPELEEVYTKVIERFTGLPNDINKAECWLRPIANAAGADADVEAAIYLASRGRSDLVDVDALRDSWHSAICSDIDRGNPIGKVPESVLERARSKTISLSEAAEILTFNSELPRFFGFRDEEEDFIDASLFRAVEWFGITGFKPWLNSIISDLSRGPQYGIDPIPSSWRLFFWCRSDLALSMADKQGLEAWLWALINGTIERDKPWRVFWSERENPRLRDNITMTGAILFIWHRINPMNMSKDVLGRASDLLFQTQMRCGAWPTYADNSEPNLMATCFAIHGLVLHRPPGWQNAVTRAAKWVWSQQGDRGAWHISGGPPVMLTVLALDAISLAEGGQEVTFKVQTLLNSSENEVVTNFENTKDSSEDEPVYDYSTAPWIVSEIPKEKSVAISDVHNIANPRIAIVVATETELKYALSALSPLPRRRQIWKTTKGTDTYFLGRIGVFECVLMLSSMSSQGPTGSTLSIASAISEWNPSALVLLGIAFGASRRKHLPGDVLISEHIIPYEHQRIGQNPMFRNPVPPSSPALINRFRNALNWSFQRPDGTICSKHVGPMLSGDKLVDSEDFKKALLDQYPNAIGGEMEGSGLWAAASRDKKDWVVVKSVCDWGDGNKHKKYQEMAAASAVSLVQYVFSDPHALDGI